MPVANYRYGHLLAPWNSPLSFGLQALVEYNGLIFNDRYQTDRITIEGITGLDDAEIEDNREKIPAASGEFPYDSYYRGRTLVINGKIETGSLPVLKTLESQFKAAFAPLEESPLKFRWFDIYDNFDDPKTIFPYSPVATSVSGNYEALVGSLDNFTIEGGLLSWSGNEENYLVRVAEQRVFGDVQATVRIISSASFFTGGFIFGVKDDENFCECSVEQTNILESGYYKCYLLLSIILEGTKTTLEKVEIPSSIGPNQVGKIFYLRGRKEENILTVEYWTEKPTEYNLPNISASYTLEGKGAQEFGNEVLSQVGFGGKTLSNELSWYFDDLHIESLYPGDVIFNAKKISPLSIKDEQTSKTKFTRVYQLTLKTSDYRALGSAQRIKSFVPKESIYSLLGRAYSRSYPLEYRKFINTEITQANTIISIRNPGTVFIEPVFVMCGPFKELGFRNLNNELEIYWSGEIKENDYLMINCGRKKTVTNSVGENKKEFFASTNSVWMVLEPLWNDIVVSAKETNENSRFICYFQPAYF